jgi:hypothetical protein
MSLIGSRKSGINITVVLVMAHQDTGVRCGDRQRAGEAQDSGEVPVKCSVPPHALT